MGHRCGVVKPGQGHSMHCGQPAEMDPVTREVMCSGCRMRHAEQETARLMRVPLSTAKPSSGPAAAVHDEFFRKVMR